MTASSKVVRWFSAETRPVISAERERDGETWRVEFSQDAGKRTARVCRLGDDDWEPALSVEFIADEQDDAEAALAVLVESVLDDYALQVLGSLSAEAGA